MQPTHAVRDSFGTKERQDIINQKIFHVSCAVIWQRKQSVSPVCHKLKMTAISFSLCKTF